MFVRLETGLAPAAAVQGGRLYWLRQKCAFCLKAWTAFLAVQKLTPAPFWRLGAAVQARSHGQRQPPLRGVAGYLWSSEDLDAVYGLLC